MFYIILMDVYKTVYSLFYLVTEYFTFLNSYLLFASV